MLTMVTGCYASLVKCDRVIFLFIIIFIIIIMHYFYTFYTIYSDWVCVT